MSTIDDIRGLKVKKWDVRASTGSTCLRIETGGRALVNAVMDLRVPKNAGKFLAS